MKHPRKTYYFITVNYNGAGSTIKYLDSIDRLKRRDFDVQVIVVDNNSEIEDFNKIQVQTQKRPSIKLIRNKKNVGYFKALNVGIMSIQDDNRFCIVGNNDIEFEEDFLLKLLKIEYGVDVLVLAPNVITKDGFHQNPHCAKRVSILRKVGYRVYFSNYFLGSLIYWIIQKLKKPRSKQCDCEWNRRQIIHMGIGACYVITENFFVHYNTLDDRVFLWGEEALLAGQIESVGGKILYDPSIIVRHNESSSVVSIPSKEAYKITKESYNIYSKYL